MDLSPSVVVRKLIQVQHRAAQVDDGFLGHRFCFAAGSMPFFLSLEELECESLFVGIWGSAKS